ncbi:MAG TPA: hemerythrin domain-containing protein [Alphaproteobacteria bacterium]|nr:hemerythrin domain-containing protein [Alphaproteobacteria bacterium]
MEMRRHVCRTLHDEHAATLSVLKRMEMLLGRHGSHCPPDLANPALAALLKDLIFGVDTEIGPHFAFEESHVFPILDQAGDHEICALLLAEHREILPRARNLAELARHFRARGLSEELWAEFHAVGAELIERLVAHIQKEEMGLLPVLDDLLEEETDGRLALQFAELR